ncbi:MAG: hypothetical protein MK193_01995 [Lentisphaeria bacterium]|nr:hypothetical protein [Lentisphaeria bacterium]
MSEELKGAKDPKESLNVDEAKGAVSPEESDVGGEGCLICWSCGARVYYPNHWDYVICRNCWATNWI